MSQRNQLSQVFKELREIILPYKRVMNCKEDIPGNFCLETFHIMKNKKPLFFGAVHTRKNYISYHLMPVYVNPKILKTISGSLQKRMQGKSCFNFKTIDRDLFHELQTLTKKCFEYYKTEGYV